MIITPSETDSKVIFERHEINVLSCPQVSSFLHVFQGDTNKFLLNNSSAKLSCKNKICTKSYLCRGGGNKYILLVPTYLQCSNLFQLHFWMGAKHNSFSQFSSEKELCFAPIRTILDGATTLHLKVFYFHKYHLFLLRYYDTTIL